MTVADLVPATNPTFYFVGVTTAKSSIMKVFPRWAAYLELGNVAMKGIDCKLARRSGCLPKSGELP